MTDLCSNNDTKVLEKSALAGNSTEGDNDSGVDESTQGNEINGDGRTPRKTSKSRTSSATPTKGSRSLSRNSKSPSLKSPDSTATTPGSATEKKKLPMNKIQVGSAPSPNLKVVKSKIGSLENASYKPGGGKVKIESKKIEIKATPRIEAKNDKYVPKGGDKKIVQQKLQWNAKSKIGSLENASYKPKGGDKKIETIKLDFKEKAAPKVGSKDNIKHTPGGGDVKTRRRVTIRENSYDDATYNIVDNYDNDYESLKSLPMDRTRSAGRYNRPKSSGNREISARLNRWNTIHSSRVSNNVEKGKPRWRY